MCEAAVTFCCCKPPTPISTAAPLRHMPMGQIFKLSIPCQPASALYALLGLAAWLRERCSPCWHTLWSLCPSARGYEQKLFISLCWSALRFSKHRQAILAADCGPVWCIMTQHALCLDPYVTFAAWFQAVYQLAKGPNMCRNAVRARELCFIH